MYSGNLFLTMRISTIANLFLKVKVGRDTDVF